MSDPGPPPPPPRETSPLEQRVAALETALEEMRQTLRSLIDALRSRGFDADETTRTQPRRVGAPPPPPRRAPPPPPRRAPAAAPASPTPAPKPPWAGRSGEWWLNRAGIGLLLLGVAFLFKYSVDQGWLTPWIRVGFGVALGVTLAVIGIRVERTQRWFTPVMLGGASATFYITGFAAFQLLQVVGYQAAFTFMIAATVFTLWSAVHHDEPVLGVLGAAGALGTPFLLYTDAGSLAGLMGYNSLVLAWTAGIYVAKGWRSLLWTSALGGWSVVVIGLWPVMSDDLDPTGADAVAFQVGVLVALLATWAAPVARHVLAARDPARWPTPPLGWIGELFGKTGPETGDRSPAVLAVAAPLIAFFATREFWPLRDPMAGTVALGLATVLAGAWWWLERHERRVRLASSHGVVVAALVAIGVQYFASRHTLLLTWAVEAVALHVIARRLGDRWVRVSAHVLCGIVALWLLQRLAGESVRGAVMLNAQGVTDALVIGALAGASLFVDRNDTRLVYRLGAVVALVGWFWRELTAPAENGYVLAAWSVVALGLHTAARRSGERAYAISGHILFGVVAGWLSLRLLNEPQLGPAVVNLRAALHAAPIAVALLAARSLATEDERRTYALTAHVGLLGWLWYELSRLPAGEGIVTVAWGAYALVLLITGLRRDRSVLRLVGLWTLAAVIGKLFLVDLNRVEALWRILLFLGFGGLFLVVSYYFRALWRRG